MSMKYRCTENSNNNIDKIWIQKCYRDNFSVGAEKIYAMLFQSERLLLQSGSLERVQ